MSPTTPILATRGPDQPACLDIFAVRAWRDQAKPGDFFWVAEHRIFWFLCPCGSGELTSIMVTEPGEPSIPGFWGWDGNLDHPTLTPSILRRTACGWHGFMTAGEWRSA